VAFGLEGFDEPSQQSIAALLALPFAPGEEAPTRVEAPS
jgi:hypothetical protein